MLWWIIPVAAYIIGFIIALVAGVDFEIALVFGAICAFVVFLIIALVAAIVAANSDMEWVEVSKTPIVALSNNVGIQGRTYLRSGYVEDTLSYYYITETDMGLKTHKVNANNSYIKYTTEQPYMITYKLTYTNDFVIWAFGNCADSTRYTFYLPEGSVITDYYNIDLQ